MIDHHSNSLETCEPMHISDISSRILFLLEVNKPFKPEKLGQVQNMSISL